MWGNEHKIHIFVEIDPFCQKVLKKHWPKVSMISDIKDYKHDGTNIDLLTGGFPCQPFSCAGKQRGKEDDRYLWPEMLRVISEVRPTWIIGENVSGIINMGLDQVLSDLENEGYKVQPFIIPACAVNAPHRRDRVWIVANRTVKNDREYLQGKEKRQVPKFGNGIEQKNVTNPNRFNGNNAGYDSSKVSQFKKTKICGLQDASNPKNKGLERRNTEGAGCSKGRDTKHAFGDIGKNKKEPWNKPWLEVATCLCRVDDGLPRRMDRTNRLKALGNAIVPQVVVPIMQAIKHIEDQKQN